MTRRAARDERWEGASPGRPRVVLECGPSDAPDLVAGVIERHGFEVRVCEGPDRRHPCSLVADGACTLVSGADVVVNLLRAEPGEPAAAVLPAVAGERRPPGIVVGQVSRSGAREPDPSTRAGSGAAVVVEAHSPVTTSALIGAIGEALEQQSRPAPSWGDGFC